MTFSLIAIDHATQALGVACATGGPALGGFVPHLLPGVGACITQGYSTNVLAAERGLDLLAQGWSIEAVIEQLRSDDRGQAFRQLALMNVAGESSGWTGDSNEPAMAMHLEPGLVVAGNMLGNARVVPAMVAAFREGNARGETLPERLLAALAAGELAGGDYRGVRSSALKVRAKGGIPLDLRIDDAHDAVPALVRLYRRIQDDADFQAFLARLPTAEAPHRH
ncbi:DUF1028 domain-containing protein [Halomonas korlensis]|uniref:Uncharacterized conserved protein, Ntn-hydrolase superfamily n=1 Tax=Halomonas korlensis TaxID=463301 RepID=A0A1I7JTQ2_9GAMM|nr:DUF1028 domain-containing protein [Halomonas korlensis]SFU88518.1 Uncharacterized conserved protein, Ntn-hydrolase superfamily [Halomonas korlensis]